MCFRSSIPAPFRRGLQKCATKVCKMIEKVTDLTRRPSTHPTTKVSCIVRHRGVQLMLAYSWTRPAILVAGKGRRRMFLLLLFLHFHSCSFLPCPSISSPLLSLFSLSLGDDTKWPTRVDVSLIHNTINRSYIAIKFQSRYSIWLPTLV